MRTTVTLDPDVEAGLQRAMRERGLSFKQALNDAVRAGLDGGRADRWRSPTRVRDLGVPRVDLDRALTLAGRLEDSELVRRAETGQ